MATSSCRRNAEKLLGAALATWMVIGVALAGVGTTMEKISTMMFMMDIKVNPGMMQTFFNALGSFSRKKGYRLDLVEMPPDKGCIGVTMVGDDLVLDGISELGGSVGACNPMSYQISIDTNFYKGAVLTGNDDAIRAIARAVADEFKAEIGPSATVVVRQQSN